LLLRLVQLDIGSSSRFTQEEDEVAWSNPLFEPPPSHILNQEETTKEESSEAIGEDTSELETKVSKTLQERLLAPIIPNRNQSRISSSISNMATQTRDDSTFRLFVFHGIGRDDAEQHWFTCEVI